jgi:hypothetical protein
VEEIRPDERVLPGIGQLEDAQVERRTKVEANEVVGAELVENLDLMRRAKRADERGRVIEPIGHRWCRTKPGQPHN